MTIQEANICDTCKERIAINKCKICEKDMCKICCKKVSINLMWSVWRTKFGEISCCKKCMSKSGLGVLEEEIGKEKTYRNKILKDITDYIKRLINLKELKEN